MTDTTTPPDEIHPLDRIFMEVDSRWAAGREYMPPITIDVKKHALRKMIYDLNQKMAGLTVPIKGKTYD